jgi:hypothetical protein
MHIEPILQGQPVSKAGWSITYVPFGFAGFFSLSLLGRWSPKALRFSKFHFTRQSQVSASSSVVKASATKPMFAATILPNF